MEWWVATWDWNTLLYLKLYCFNALRCMPTQPDNHIIISIIKRNGKSLFIKRVQKKHHRRHEASNTAVRFCWYKVIVSIIHFCLSARVQCNSTHNLFFLFVIPPRKKNKQTFWTANSGRGPTSPMQNLFFFFLVFSLQRGWEDWKYRFWVFISSFLTIDRSEALSSSSYLIPLLFKKPTTIRLKDESKDVHQET